MRTRIIIGLLLTMAVTLSAVAMETLIIASEQDPGLPAYIEARQLLMRGNYAHAAEKFEAFISAYPQSKRVDDALYYLGYCRERLGQKTEAFRNYSEAIDKFGDTTTSRRSLLRALDLAQRLRQKKGDVYDDFLTGKVEGEAFRSYRLNFAIRLAELGDWRDLDVIIEGMEKSDDAMKVRIASLLGNRIADRRVIEAYDKALSTSENEIVRMSAAANLSRVSSLKPIRLSLAKAMREDKNEFVRLAAARTLQVYINEDEIEQAYSHVIRHETSPMVISTAIEVAGPHLDGEEFENVLLERIEAEPDTMAKYALMNGLRFRRDVGPHSEVFIRFLQGPAPPVMKINALNMLAPRVHEPEVRTVVLETLEHDPNVHVKMTAASHLAAHIEEVEVRDAMLTVTLDNSDNLILVSTTVRALTPKVRIPEVRSKLVELLHVAESPRIAETVVMGLSTEGQSTEVQIAFLDLIEGTENVNLKAFTLRRFGKVADPAILDRIEGLYRTEENPAVAQLYLALVYEADPARADRLSPSAPNPQ